MYVWSSEGGGVRGWRVENLGRSKLSAAMGKLTFSKTQPKIIPSWPLVQEVCCMFGEELGPLQL